MSESAGPESVGRPDLADDVTQRYVTMVLATFSLLVMTSIAFIVPLPYSTLQPGPVHDTLADFGGEPLIQFGDDVEVYDTDGTLMLTTAMVSSVDADLRLHHALTVYLRPNSALIPSRFLNPGNDTAEESRERAQLDMERSQRDAEVAGVRAAGYEVAERAVVAGVVEDGPSAGLLEVGDLLRGVDGVATETLEDFVARVSMVEVGDEVTVTVERDDDEIDVVVTTAEHDEIEGRPVVGIQVGQDFDVPIEVDNNLGHQIGGASAGVIFALAIYDRLTPGPLTGGLRVAGTGEITAAGEVGRIGGVHQKLAGAAHQGRAQVFLVPEGNCAEASAAPDFGMVVVSVADLDGAIAALEALGGPGDGHTVSGEELRERAEAADLPLCH